MLIRLGKSGGAFRQYFAGLSFYLLLLQRRLVHGFVFLSGRPRPVLSSPMSVEGSRRPGHLPCTQPLLFALHPSMTRIRRCLPGLLPRMYRFRSAYSMLLQLWPSCTALPKQLWHLLVNLLFLDFLGNKEKSTRLMDEQTPLQYAIALSWYKLNQIF